MFHNLNYLSKMFTIVPSRCQAIMLNPGTRRRSFIRAMATKIMKETPSNPVVIVTGSSRGIGKAIATALAEVGCKVVINYSTNDTLALEVVKELKDKSALKGGTAIAIKTNVASAEEVKAMFTQVAQEVRCYFHVYCILSYNLFSEVFYRHSYNFH